MKSFRAIIPFTVGEMKSFGYIVAKDDIKTSDLKALFQYKYCLAPYAAVEIIKPYIKIAVCTFENRQDLLNLAQFALNNIGQNMILNLPDLSIFEGITVEHYNKSNVTEFHKFIKYYNPSILFAPVQYACKNSAVKVSIDPAVKGYTSVHVNDHFVCIWKPSTFTLDNKSMIFEYENNVVYLKHFEKVYLLLDSKQRHKPYEIGEQLNIDLRDGSAILYKNEVRNNMFYSNIYKFNKTTLMWHLVKTNQSFEVYATKRA